MEKFAILINELKNNDMNVCAFNCVSNMSKTIDSCIYGNLVENSLWTRLSCPILNIAEIYRFNGVLFSTCETTCQIAANLPNKINHYHYVWDLEWMNKNDFTFYSDMYTKNKLISRSQYHADIIQSVWGVKSLIIEEMDHVKIGRL